MALLNAFGEVATELTLEASLDAFQLKFAPIVNAKTTKVLSGDTDLITPAAGNGLVVVQQYVQAKGALGVNYVIVRIRMIPDNDVEFELTGSQQYMDPMVWVGDPDEPFTITTDSTAAVMFNISYREYTP